MAQCILEPNFREADGTIGSSPRKNASANPELFKVDSDGKMSIPDKHGPLKIISTVKGIMTNLKFPPPPTTTDLLKDESKDLCVKQGRLLAFAKSDNVEDQLSDMIQSTMDNLVLSEDTKESVILNLNILKDCKDKIICMLNKTFLSQSREELTSSLSELRSNLTEIMHGSSAEDLKISNLRNSLDKISQKWGYLSGKLAEEICDKAQTIPFTVPTDIHVHSLYYAVKAKHRIAEKWKKRITDTQEYIHSPDLYDKLMSEDAIEITGNIAEYECDDKSGDIPSQVELAEFSDSDYSSTDDDDEASFQTHDPVGGESGSTALENDRPPSNFFYYDKHRRRNSAYNSGNTKAMLHRGLYHTVVLIAITHSLNLLLFFNSSGETSRLSGVGYANERRN